MKTEVRGIQEVTTPPLVSGAYVVDIGLKEQGMSKAGRRVMDEPIRASGRLRFAKHGSLSRTTERDISTLASYNRDTTGYYRA